MWETDIRPTLKHQHIPTRMAVLKKNENVQDFKTWNLCRARDVTEVEWRAVAVQMPRPELVTPILCVHPGL